MLALTPLAGCNSPKGYKSPLLTYRTASKVVLDNTRTLYMNKNEIGRDAVIDEYIRNNQPIDKTEVEKKNEPLNPTAMVVRMAALDALDKYSQLLLALANSSAPEEAKKSAESLGASLRVLSDALNASKIINPDDKGIKAAQGFASLAGDVLKLALEQKISKSLDRIIEGSEVPGTELLKLLKSETHISLGLIKRYTSSALASALHKYNAISSDSKKLSQRTKEAGKIKALFDSLARQALLRESTAGIDPMLKAFGALVAYARSDKGPIDSARLAMSMDTFSSQATFAHSLSNTITNSKE